MKRKILALALALAALAGALSVCLPIAHHCEHHASCPFCVQQQVLRLGLGALSALAAVLALLRPGCAAERAARAQTPLFCSLVQQFTRMDD